MQTRHLKAFLSTIYAFKFCLARQLKQQSSTVDIAFKLKNKPVFTLPPFTRRGLDSTRGNHSCLCPILYRSRLHTTDYSSAFAIHYVVWNVLSSWFHSEAIFNRIRHQKWLFLSRNTISWQAAFPSRTFRVQNNILTLFASIKTFGFRFCWQH